MAVTLRSERVSRDTWRLYFSSGLSSPIFRIWRNGVRVGVTRGNSITLTVKPGGHDDIVVLDTAAPPPESAQPYPRLSWPGVTGTASYRVEQYVDGAYVTRQVVAHAGAGQHRWESPVILAGSSQAYRITPVDTGGRDGTPVTPTVNIVALPPPPVVGYDFDNATHVVTITNAA